MGYKAINYIAKNDDNAFRNAVVSFFSTRCEDMLYDPNKANETMDNKDSCTGISNGQPIPYNTLMDINRLCFENAVKRFLKTGNKTDAFDVYFCYLEMFVGDYKTSKKMIELLSEYEENGSRLLMKHRDHYSHSVYVFLIGTAIYETNSRFREAYNKYYNVTGKKAAEHFMRYWGMTSLFHDVGYPFELPFEQVESYFEIDKHKRKEDPFVKSKKEKRDGTPFLAYNALDQMTGLSDDLTKLLKKEYGLKFKNTDHLFSHILTEKLSSEYGFSEVEMYLVLSRKATHPDEFSYFMDHAYFSANILFKNFLSDNSILNNGFDLRTVLDSFIAVLMHNSLYKINIAAANKPFRMELHPLAYLLMLCDELQCWDRTAYGRNSRTQIHPMNCEFDFSDNKLHVKYIFDSIFEGKVREYEKRLKASGKSDVKPVLESYSDFAEHKVENDIKEIVDLSDIDFSISTDLRKNEHTKDSFLSTGSFVNLYNFAIVLNGRYNCLYKNENEEWAGEWAEYKNGRITFEQFLSGKDISFEKDFCKLSLEYKLSNINQAKSFDKYLNTIGCFYSDKEYDFDMVESFSTEEVLKIGPMEHKRWLQEHYEMGWTFGEEKKDYNGKFERENFRCHKDMIAGFEYTGEPVTDSQAEENFKNLGKEEQEKDVEPMECMLALLKVYDGLRVYRL